MRLFWLLCWSATAHADVLLLTQMSASRPEVAKGVAALQKRTPTKVTDVGSLDRTALAAAFAGLTARTHVVLLGVDRGVDCALPHAFAIDAISVGGRLPKGGCFASLGAHVYTPADPAAVTRALEDIARSL